MNDAAKKRIDDLYGSLNRLDHYGLLNVSATADAKDIRRCYFVLAKEFHPDRWFRQDIGSMRAKVQAIFTAMTTAEATLCDAAKRVEYDGYLRDVLKTRIDRRRAEALESERQWAAAAEIWERIVEQLPTDAYVQHCYAYALLRAGIRYETALAAATRAIDLDTARAEYRITAAALHLAEDRERSAVAQLAVACEIEPDRRDITALHAALAARVARTR